MKEEWEVSHGIAGSSAVDPRIEAYCIGILEQRIISKQNLSDINKKYVV